MSRLGRGLIAIVAAGLALGIGAPTAALVLTREDQRTGERDARLAAAALDTLVKAPERLDRPGDIDTSLYEETPRAPGQPLTAVLDRRGVVLVSDRRIPGSLRSAAHDRARRDNDDPATVAGSRFVAMPIQGERQRIGAVVAYESAGGELLGDALTLGGVALAGWLLLTGLAALLVNRALGPASAVAAREEAFLADAAHELRTPLAVIGGRAQRALANGAKPEDLQAIAAAAAGAGTTITDMLELARLDAGRALGDREPVRLDALVATCVTNREATAEVPLHLDTQEVIVDGDDRLLARAVDNLLDNAIKHGASGGMVAVAVMRDGPRALVHITDHGPGVAPGNREQIFERFQSSAGTGLGLPIARLIARAHDGDVTFTPGEPGATFTLALPVARA